MFPFRFDVDMVTGNVFLNQAVDREKRDVYYLMFIATDGGNIRTSVPLTINVGDINDEKPYFRRLQYDGVIREGEDRFSRPLIMEVGIHHFFLAINYLRSTCIVNGLLSIHVEHMVR